nr:MAG TPA: hypothetical protein [Caudoviricetes sp.]
MKTALNLTCIATFIYLAVGVGSSILSSSPADVWGGGLVFFIFIVGIPWALFGLFKIFLLALYYTRKTWLQATQDAKPK